MRQIDRPEDMAPLPPPIKNPEMPKQHKKVSDGVFKGPDGRLYTDKQPPTIWDAFNIKPAKP